MILYKKSFESVGKFNLLSYLPRNGSFVFFFLYVRIKNITMKIPLFILFASTATSLAQSTHVPINYDITTLLNNSIARTFKNLDSDKIQELIFNMESDDSIKYDTGINYMYRPNPFQKGNYFTGVNITILNLNLESVRLHHSFAATDMIIFFPKLSIKIKGYLGTANDTVHIGFVRSVDLGNVSIIAYKVPKIFRKEKLYLYMTYEDGFESNYMYEPWFHPDVKLEERYELEQKVKSMLPALFIDTLKHNEKFLKSLNAIFCDNLEDEITSQYPDFKNNAEKYHYFIPNITSLQRTLSNITISGLWNFHSHTFSVHLKQIVTRLVIKNIRGYANLYYGSQNSTIFPLRFEADFISILLDEEMERVNVTAYNYSVWQTDVNSSLTEYQSKWVMEGIELAIASSIMPSIKSRDESRNQREHPIVKISTKMSQQFQGSAIQKLYQNWNISMLENITAESTLQLGSSNYTISIWGTPTEAFLPSPYPNCIQCIPYEILRIYFGLPCYLFGKIRLNNSTHQFDDIDVMMSDISATVIKRNNSEGDDDFEFNGGEDKVELISESDESDFTEIQLEAIFQKTKEMLTSSIFEILKLLTKPLLSLSLDYCTAPVKLFDDFLPFFADHELAYHVLDSHNRSTDQFFTSKMNNVVMEEWKKLSNIWISFYNSDENLSSVVSTELGKSKIRMNINDTSVQSEDPEWQFVFRSVVLKNFTDIGNIQVHMFYDERYPVRNNVSLFARESYWFKAKLEYIIGESFKNINY